MWSCLVVSLSRLQQAGLAKAFYSNAGELWWLVMGPGDCVSADWAS